MVNMSKRAKGSSKKHREVFKGRMMMTQSSPFIQRGITKPPSPDRTDMGGHTRVAQSRVSRYISINKRWRLTLSL